MTCIRGLIWVARAPSDVQSRCIGYMDTLSLISLSWTSRKMHELCMTEWKRHVWKQLGEVVGDVDSFLSLLKVSLRCKRFSVHVTDLAENQRYDAVVSGSFVLSLIMRNNHWKPGDMDIYVPRGSHHAFVSDLAILVCADRVDAPTATQGYVSARTASSISTVQTVRTGHFKYDIVESRSSCASSPIPLFHSTCVMNYLSHSHLSIGYPRYTLHMSSVYNPAHSISPNWHTRILRKWTDRGFFFSSTASALPQSNTRGYCNTSRDAPIGSSACSRRSFLDSKSFVLVLGNNNSSRKASFNEEEKVEWWMTGSCCDREPAYVLRNTLCTVVPQLH